LTDGALPVHLVEAARRIVAASGFDARAIALAAVPASSWRVLASGRPSPIARRQFSAFTSAIAGMRAL
jgi:hypothetical protein